MRLCHIDDLQNNEAKGFKVEGKSIFAVKKDDSIHVYLNACPHLGINLEFRPNEFLDMDKTFIQCANLGALFEIVSGNCVMGPCTGQSLERIEVNIESGFIEL